MQTRRVADYESCHPHSNIPKTMEERQEKLRLLIFAGIQEHSWIDISNLVFTQDDWVWLFNESKKQAIAGIVWHGVVKLIEDDRLPSEQFPPKELDMKWQTTYESIKAANANLSWVASLLTELTDSNGNRNAVLKGQSKALCYMSPEERTPGDLDFWVENGKEYAEYLIRQFNLEGKFSYHHFHCKANLMSFRNVPLEIHFRPSSGCFNPSDNKKIQAVLESLVRKTSKVKTSHGYINTPLPPFNMISELVHIRRHFVGGGIGMRHMIDFYYICQSCSTSGYETLLKDLGLYKFAGVVAYVMCRYLNLNSKDLFGQELNERAGRLFLEDILRGGNFGWFAPRQQHNILARLLLREWRTVRLFSICPSEFFWYELHYWWTIVKTIPTRIKRRKLSLREDE